MDNKYFSEIYDDFFTVKKEEIKEEISDVDLNIEVDNLYLDDESKSLLKQIIEYIKKYNNKEESNYINFNIIFECKTKECRNKIIDILKKTVSNTDYLINDSVYNLSLFELNNKINTIELYDKNGIISINDLSSITMQQDNNKKIFFYNMGLTLNKRNITLLCGSKEEIDNFKTYNEETINKYFNFRLVEVIPTSQDIYNEVLEKVNVTDEQSIELLDYITVTHKEINDYTEYRDKLINYISFHKAIPKVKEEKNISEIFSELDELVGLDDIKKILHDLVNLIELKKKSDLKINDVNLHMLFLGNPGTGKTTVARMLSGILYNLGYIKENKLMEVTSKDLVAEYVGQTSIKTNSVIERALGGVLFIDEAYSLSSKLSTYNDEAIATLIKGMEDNRDNLVVIFAGYTKEMQDFINSNSGIASRIGYTLDFKDYTEDELVKILEGMVKKSGFEMTDKAIEKVRIIIKDNKGKPNFGNARFIRNLFEKSIILHATNTKNNKSKKILRTLTDKDINIDNILV
ncbi:MAG: AAA family ATPase [Bacilli bacterium]|nr:AAA family ATPase [Bacilli bacterium]